MRREASSITDANGQRQMRAVFETLGWAVRSLPQDSDIGLDFEVEVFEDFRSTGQIFKVQLKSSESSIYSIDGSLISQRMKKKHVAYYCQQLREPMILIHADTSAGKTFWCAPQLMRIDEISESERESSSKTTLHLQTKLDLPESIRELLVAVGRIRLLLGTKEVTASSLGEFVKQTAEQFDTGEVIRDLRNKVDALTLSQLQDLYISKQFKAAKKVINRLLEDDETMVSIRFWALLEEERIDWRLAAEAGAPQVSLPLIREKFAKRRLQISRSGSLELKFWALLDLHSAKLENLCHRAGGLAMNYRNLEAHKSMYWAFQAYSERAEVERLLVLELNRCIRLTRFGSVRKMDWRSGRSISSVCRSLTWHTVALFQENRRDELEVFLKASFDFIQRGRYLCSLIDDQEGVVIAASQAFQMSEFGSPQMEKWGLNVVESIPEPTRSTALDLIKRQLDRRKGERQPGDLYGTGLKRQAFENMASAIGIDMANPADPVANLIHAAIRDDDPTDILSGCEHRMLTLGPQSERERLLSERLGAAIGQKAVHCLKHGYGKHGPEGRDAFNIFQAAHCCGCPDITARSPDWVYTREWHTRTVIENQDIIATYWGLPVVISEWRR